MLTFSFRHLDLNHDKFSVEGRDGRYLTKLLSRLRDVCCMTMAHLKADRSKALHSHPIRWPETSEPDGYSHLNEQLQSCEPWQFSVSGNEYGRVHGFVIDTIFYVVWLDPDHQLYPKRD